MNELLSSVFETGPDLAIRATVLFAVASGVALTLTRASAAQRHLVWAAALTASLVLPVIHVCAPAWGVLPAFTAARNGSPATIEPPVHAERPILFGTDRAGEYRGFALSPLPRGEAGRIPGEGASGAARISRTSPPLPLQVGERLMAHAAPHTIGEKLSASATVSVGQSLVVLWLAGVLLGCVRLTLAVGRIRQFARRADPATGRTASLLTELARESGIRRPVQGLVSRQSIVPMTWGWLRPVVLLPADAASWSAERLRVVLLHELAHVRRGDAATQFVAELARSLYWFHPLSWWGVRCLRVEQEAACDDRVLAAGAAADDYAEELVSVTARLPHGLQAAGLAVAMGRRHMIEDRVRSILADDRDRRPVRAMRAALIGSVFATLATVTAIIGPAADAEDAPAGSVAQPPAAELLEDPRQIKALTPGLARKLVAKPHDGSLYLYALTTLDTDTAQVLAQFPGSDVHLSGLTRLDTDTAQALAQFSAPRLFLDGLTAIDAGTAQALAQFSGDALILRGLTALDTDTAKALAEFRGRILNLEGLTALDADSAKELASYEGMLTLEGLTKLGSDTAKALAESKSSLLSLRGLRSLDAATAMALAKSKAWEADLPSMATLDVETAEALAARESGFLSLNGLHALDAATAQALAAYKGHVLKLDGLTKLGTDTAKALAGCKCNSLYLNGLTTLDAATAKALAECTCNTLFLEGLATLDADTAKAIAAFKGESLFLNRLTAIDSNTAQALAEFKGNDVFLNGLTTLDTDTAEALAELKAWNGQLPNLTALDADTAKALAEFKGQSLDLSGLTTLDIDTAKALANHAGTVGMSPDVVHELMAKHPFDKDTALAYAALAGGVLESVTGFESPDSIAIAKALAKRQGPLALPNLKRISPKTLTALIEKEDVEIPPIETLELIPEPDGSPTEDFVIPEGFQQR